MLQKQCTKPIEVEAYLSSSMAKITQTMKITSIQDLRLTGEKLDQTSLEFIHYLN